MNGDLALIEPLAFDPPKTRRVAALLAGIGRGSENILFLTAGHKPDVHQSARNLPGVRVLPWGEASAYDILWSDLVLVESSVFDAAGDSAFDAAGDSAFDAVGDSAGEGDA